MVKKWLKRLGWTLVLIGVGIQFVPVNRTNPPVVAGQALSPPPAVAAIMQVACYDCHSNETRWPWYAYVAPMSWLVTNHVTEGRAHMDFSTWGSYKPEKQANFLRGVDDAVTNGWMPLESYLLIHRDAVLTPAQAKTVADWAHATAKQLDPSGSDDDDDATKPPTPGAA
jgi:hypothetical protein